MLKTTEKNTIINCPNLANHERKVFDGLFTERDRSKEQEFCNKLCAEKRQEVCKAFIDEAIDHFNANLELIEQRKREQEVYLES